ncbi:hypothetical protein AALP_AA8G313800 [Arabis alpina]|uniref:DUF4283 domain-containing protein n=1 Tax=Arabis alpina TaxID=50452 RepID=A0A087GAP1_ARAAL|nr:hypothetical protein AALP_AA8G313800 [Arabis alpina]
MENDVKKEGQKDKPIKLPPLDKTQILKRFERTLVGRVLLREAREHNHKALISFLPTVWRCEGRVHGMEMGDGKIHFRFQNEEDLETVMVNRPYHYDGSMIALERWIPTVRRDFPNTIPFWIVIQGLPDYRRDEDSVTSIGEALGEWMDVDVSEPTPRVRVLLDCNSPLVVRRESDNDGVLVRLDFRYEKLQKHCTRCMRITHEAPLCPERPRDQRRGEDRGGSIANSGGQESQATESPWYRDSEEEARIANSVQHQSEKREAFERFQAKTDVSREERNSNGGGREARVSAKGSGAQAEKLELVSGPGNTSTGIGLLEAQEDQTVGEGVLELLNPSLGLGDNLSPTGMISPLKEFLVGVNTVTSHSERLEDRSGGKHGSQRLDKIINKSLGVCKKIGSSPFQGKRIHKHVALAQLESENAIPSTSKTGPVKGKCSEEPKEPVVKEKPPADA